jgi:osmotically-inducible protein OsmY
MGRIACALTLVLTGLMFAQQHSPSAAGTSPILTEREAAQETSGELTTPEVQRLIHDGLSSETDLAHASVIVRTDDRAIVLMGNVANERQHEVALRIAQSFTGGRQIVDKIRVTSAQ